MSTKIRNWDFFGHRYIFFAISLSVMVIGILFNIIFGVKLDITFKGGTLIKYSFTGSLTSDPVSTVVKDTLNKTPDVQITTSTDGSSVINVSLTEALTLDEQTKLTNALTTKFSGNKITVLKVNSLNPTMGQKFFFKCIVAIALASLFLVIYVAFRFRKIGGWSAGAMGLVALLHDCLVAYFTFVIFGIPLDDNFVAVVLGILGYSLNDTIVIYDRIRENRRLLDKTTPIADIVNLSINQSFTRSFNTALCTFVSIGTVAVLALFYGLDSITSFALPMMLGVISGCYSSICVAGPLWVMWQNYRARKDSQKPNTAKKVKA